jgi:RNase adapter protein RapZ
LISIISLIGETESEDRLTINVISFGYKGGVPIDADIVMDVRFLPNPFYEEALRDLNGLSKDVSSYVNESVIGKEFINKFTDLLFFILPLYKKESKNQVTLAFGCTGGKHRSVAIANIVGKILTEKGYKVNIFNRDIYNDNNLEK